MAMFKFSLEQVLVYRTQLEDKAKAEFGRLQSDMALEKSRQAQLIKEMYQQEKSLVMGSVDLAERWLVESYMKALRIDIAQSDKKIRTLDVMVQGARTKLAHCSKDRLIMVKLKEKHEKSYISDELQKEQREFDEIASIRFQTPSY